MYDCVDHKDKCCYYSVAVAVQALQDSGGTQGRQTVCTEGGGCCKSQIILLLYTLALSKLSCL